MLKRTSMTAILVEVCFVDTKADADAYNRAGYQAVAAAIADAISGTNQTTGSTPAPSEPSGASSDDIADDTR